MTRHQPDEFARRLESRHAIVSLVRLVTRCRYCDRRVVEALAVDVPHGVAHERCWERRLRAGRPALWLVDRAGKARRSSLAPRIEDGAHAALREFAGATILPTLRARVMEFLQIATARGLVPVLPSELPSTAHGREGGAMLLARLHAARAPRLFALLLQVGRDIREAEAVASMREAVGDRA